MPLQVYVKDNEPPIVVPTWKIPFLYVHSFVWNLLRRPLVKKWKMELEQISSNVQKDLKQELLPYLYDNMRQGCTSCRDLYGFLRGAIYVSQIQQVIKKEYCHEHYLPFHQFEADHFETFNRNHELSDLICGFKSNPKV